MSDIRRYKRFFFNWGILYFVFVAPTNLAHDNLTRLSRLCKNLIRQTYIQTNGQTDILTDQRTNKQTYIQTNGQTDRHTYRPTDRQTDIHTDIKTDRQTDTHTNTHIDTFCYIYIGIILISVLRRFIPFYTNLRQIIYTNFFIYIAIEANNFLN